MDGELPAVPLVAVRDREAHHPGARFEVGHASAQPVVERAGANVEAPGNLPLADPSGAWGITWMSWLAGQGGSRGMPRLPERDGNQASVVQAHWKDRRPVCPEPCLASVGSHLPSQTEVGKLMEQSTHLQKPQQKMVEAAGIEPAS